MTKNGKIISTLLLSILILLMFISCVTAETMSPTLQIDVGKAIVRENGTEKEIVLFTGKTVKLSGSIEHVENSKKAKITWESSDPAVATVGNGVVTGKSEGTAEISCRALLENGDNLNASYKVVVETGVKSISIKPNTVSVFSGDKSDPLSYEIKPDNATCKTVSWISSDDSIATVDNQGVITGIKAGKVKISAISNEPVAENGKPVQTAVNATITQRVQGISLGSAKDTTIELAKGKTYPLKVAISPDDATNKKVTWSSSNPNVVTVSSNGTVTGKGIGTAEVTCTADDGSGISSTVAFRVYQAVTGVKINGNRVAVTQGETHNLSVTVSPKDASNKAVSWSSSDSSVATVDSNGKITAKSVGTCSITATAKDGSEKKGKITVIVEPKIPLDAVRFTRSGYFGFYNEFAVTFHNVTKTRTIKYIQFDLQYNQSGSSQKYTGFCTDSDTLGPGSKKQIGWWDQIGYALGYCSNFRVYLTAVMYADGTFDYFTSNNLIGWFN